MNRMIRRSIWVPLAAVLVLSLARESRAAARPADASAAPGTVPSGINYQGRLVDNGFPVTATRNMTFRLYDAPTGGNLLWTSPQQAVAVNQGIFGTTLALSTPTLAGAAQKYLEVQVDNTTLSPREPLQAVPYALIAKSVEDNLSLTSLTAGSSVTASAFFGDGSHLSGVSGSLAGGTAGYMAKWSSPTTLVLSNFWETASSDTVMGAGGLGVVSSVTASAFFGDGSHLTGVTAAGVAAPNVAAGTFGAGVLLPAAGLTNGPVASAILPSTVAFTSVANTFVASQTVTAAGGLGVAYGLSAGSITLTGAGGTIASASSVTASAFFGDGSHLAGVGGTLGGGSAGYLPKWTGASSEGLSSFWETSSSDTALGAGGLAVAYGLSAGSITLAGAGGTIASASSVTASAFFGDGSHLTGVGGTLSGGSAGYLPKWTGASSEGLSSFWETSSSDTALGAGGLAVAYGLSVGSITLTGAGGTIASASSVTASAFFGDGSHLTGASGTDNTKVLKAGDAMTGPLTLAGSTLTVTGNAFSVGATSTNVYVGPAGVGIGTIAPASMLNLSGASSAGIAYTYVDLDQYSTSNVQFGGVVTRKSHQAAVGNTATVGGEVLGSYGFMGNTGAAFSQGAFIYGIQNGAAGASYVPTDMRFDTSDGVSAAQERMRITASGNVGVGTANPSTKLHMSSGTLTVDGNAATGLQVYGSTFVVQQSGNVGVGTASPGNLLQVGSGTGASVLAYPGAMVSAAGFGQFSVRSDAGGEIGMVAGNANKNFFGNFTNHDLEIRTNNVAAVYITKTQSVGLGTKSPATLLHMSSGTLTVDGTNAAVSVAGGSVTASAFFGDGSHLSGVSATDSTKVAKAGDAMTGPLTLAGSTLTVAGSAFSVGGSTFVVAGGLVGIGTANPTWPLTLSGPSSQVVGSSCTDNTTSSFGGFAASADNPGIWMLAHSSARVLTRFGQALGGWGEISLATGNSTPKGLILGTQQATPLLLGTNNAERLRIDSSGNVGVGTPSPASKLHLSSGTLTIDGNAATGLQVYGSTFVVQQNGSVGVGTANPQTSLDVNGAIRAGTTAAACSAALGGALRFNSGTSNYELCNGAGATWLVLEPAYAWADVSANTTAIKGGRYLVNTSGGAVTLTLPAAPAAGDRVAIVDSGGAFATNNLTVARNGSNIMALAQDMTVSTNYVSFELVYDGAANGWRIK